MANMIEDIRKAQTDLTTMDEEIKNASLLSGPLKDLRAGFVRKTNEALLAQMGDLHNKLEKVNPPLAKAVQQGFDKEKGSKRARKEVIKGNIGISWDEAFQNIGHENHVLGDCLMNVHLYAKVKNMLDENAQRGRLYFYMEEVIDVLDKEESEKANLSKLLMKNTPIVQVLEGEKKVYMDARVLLNQPEEAYKMVMLDTEKEPKKKGGGSESTAQNRNVRKRFV